MGENILGREATEPNAEYILSQFLIPILIFCSRKLTDKVQIVRRVKEKFLLQLVISVREIFSRGGLFEFLA